MHLVFKNKHNVFFSHYEDTHTHTHTTSKGKCIFLQVKTTINTVIVAISDEQCVPETETYSYLLALRWVQLIIQEDGCNVLVSNYYHPA